MAIHGLWIGRNRNDSVSNGNFLQVNEVHQSIINTIVNSGSAVYPYTAWNQYNSEIALSIFQQSDNYGSGWEIEGVAGETIGTGEVVYRFSNTRWKKAIGDGTTLAEGINMIGLCIQGGNNNDSIKILLHGFASISSSNFNQQLANGSRANGVPVYLDAATYGYMTDVAPASSGNVVRTMGFMFSNPYNTGTSGTGADGNPVIYFNPDRTFIIV